MPDRRLIQFARELRKSGTDAERRIWSYLRGQRLGGNSFRRQHPVGPYIADFYCHAARLIVELDGGQHSDPEAVAYDERRAAAMSAQGIDVIRFSDVDALKDSEAVARAILAKVERRVGHSPPPVGHSPPPLPSPGVPGEGATASPSTDTPGIATLSPSPGTPGEGRG